MKLKTTILGFIILFSMQSIKSGITDKISEIAKNHNVQNCISFLATISSFGSVSRFISDSDLTKIQKFFALHSLILANQFLFLAFVYSNSEQFAKLGLCAGTVFSSIALWHLCYKWALLSKWCNEN